MSGRPGRSVWPGGDVPVAVARLGEVSSAFVEVATRVECGSDSFLPVYLAQVKTLARAVHAEAANVMNLCGVGEEYQGDSGGDEYVNPVGASVAMGPLQVEPVGSVISGGDAANVPGFFVGDAEVGVTVDKGGHAVSPSLGVSDPSTGVVP